MIHYDKLIFEVSRDDRRTFALNALDVPAVEPDAVIPTEYIREGAAPLPKVTEVDIVRHFVNLSKKNVGVDTTFYPLGSCTMKYNPKINETIAAMPSFANLHPYQDEDSMQGMLGVLYELQQYLGEISGFDAISLQPAAGAHGELACLLMARRWFDEMGEGQKRRIILIPDSAHGTNPASSIFAGFKTMEVASDSEGLVDLKDLKKKVDDTTAVLMLTNPNTLGLYEKNVKKIADILHEHGALLFVDGANLNATMGISRPAEMGADFMHINLHKTFATPHGGGGPGAGPVGVVDKLRDYLPAPVVGKNDSGRYFLDYDLKNSIGRMRSFYGMVGVCVKAWAYIRQLGADGVREVSEHAVLNANYLRARLTGVYNIKYNRTCMHEFVADSTNLQKEYGVDTTDVAKALLDRGIHPPTTYFPLIIHEALMIEPTETESKATLDGFADAMIEIAELAKTNPEELHEAPKTWPVRRLDGVKAVREPILKWTPTEGETR